jgi:hypothetical protein
VGRNGGDAVGLGGRRSGRAERSGGMRGGRGLQGNEAVGVQEGRGL